MRSGRRYEEKSGRFCTTLLVLALTGLVGVLHAFLLLSLYWWVHLLVGAMSLIAAWLLWDKIARTE